ncbi:MAG: hypothetical protein M3680_24310 [Myxococcota bacterium]|nr:hypothetical protein [Myxococcota bacterium]
MTRLLSLTSLALVSLLSTAAAEPRSWTASKAVLPDQVTVVAGASLSAMRATQLYQTIVPPLIAKESDAKRAFELARSTCSIDLHAAIDDATFAVGADERGVVVLGLARGMDQKRIVDCLNRIVAKQAKDRQATTAPAPGRKGGAKAKQPATTAPKITVTTSGRIAEYSMTGETDKLYLAWLAPDVVAIATDPEDRALLERMTSGNGARGNLAGVLGKVNTNATVWFTTTKQTPVQATGATTKALYGTIETTGGQVKVDTHAIMGSAKEAKKLVDDATALLGAMKSQVPPMFIKAVDSLKMVAVGEDATMKFGMSEKDLISLIALVLPNL